MKLLKPHVFNPGDKKVIEKEEFIENLNFKKIKFNNRKTPDNINQILIICNFSEFGCESVAVQYIIPELVAKNPEKYIIVVGWFGREYLYKHLVDEYWELNEEHQWLREYSRAFHHSSKNLKRLEKNLKNFGRVFPTVYLGYRAVGSKCNDCNWYWGTLEHTEKCSKCGSNNIIYSLYGDASYWKNKVVRVPFPKKEVKKYLNGNDVAVFARGRICYGRNLTPEFYIKLINYLKNKNYNPIWMGEKQSTLPCPVDDIIDFSRMEESRDLETSLSIIQNCKFTIQFWTASTRLAAMVDTPFLLVESPDQIFGLGQEGFRLQLTTFGKRKMIYSDYLEFFNNTDAGLETVSSAIDQMENNNWNDMIGLVSSKDMVEAMIKDSISKNKWC